MGSSKGDVEQGQQAEAGPNYYGTFQGQPNFPQPVPPGQPSYPQPVPPSQAPHYAPTDRNYQYQPVHGNYGGVVEGRPISGEQYHRSENLPFCNLGFGWFLFLLGFLFVIPWYIGAIIFFCLAHDYRERTGLMACTIAAIIFLLAGGSKAGGRW